MKILAAALLIIFAGTTCTLYAAAPTPPVAPTATTPAQSIPGTVQKDPAPLSQAIDPDKIPDNDNIITQVFPLSFLTGHDALTSLASFVSPRATLAATNNAIIITDTSSNVKHIAQIIKMLDAAPPTKNIIVVVPINPGTAAEAARQVNAVMNPPKN